MKKEAEEDDEDIDFIGQADTPAAGNLQHVNLFGVPLSEVDQLDLGKEKEESITEKNQRAKVARELITIMQALDTENITQDFEAPK